MLSMGSIDFDDRREMKELLSRFPTYTQTLNAKQILENSDWMNMKIIVKFEPDNRPDRPAALSMTASYDTNFDDINKIIKYFTPIRTLKRVIHENNRVCFDIDLSTTSRLQLIQRRLDGTLLLGQPVRMIEVARQRGHPTSCGPIIDSETRNYAPAAAASRTDYKHK